MKRRIVISVVGIMIMQFVSAFAADEPMLNGQLNMDKEGQQMILYKRQLNELSASKSACNQAWMECADLAANADKEIQTLQEGACHEKKVKCENGLMTDMKELRNKILDLEEVQLRKQTFSDSGVVNRQG